MQYVAGITIEQEGADQLKNGCETESRRVPRRGVLRNNKDRMTSDPNSEVDDPDLMLT